MNRYYYEGDEIGNPQPWMDHESDEAAIQAGLDRWGQDRLAFLYKYVDGVYTEVWQNPDPPEEWAWEDYDALKDSETLESIDRELKDISRRLQTLWYSGKGPAGGDVQPRDREEFEQLLDKEEALWHRRKTLTLDVYHD